MIILGLLHPSPYGNNRIDIINELINSKSPLLSANQIAGSEKVKVSESDQLLWRAKTTQQWLL